MSGLEALAVIGCIAAVCSAYVDGSDLVHNLRRRRAQKKALQGAPKEDGEAERLETSLTTGNTAIRSRYDQHFRLLGNRYAQGDQHARDQLKDIIIHLQGVVITNLKYAWREDTTVDFQMLQDTSDESQMRAILCLIDLNKRMLVAAPITQMPAPVPDTQSHGFIVPEDEAQPMKLAIPIRQNPTRNDSGAPQSIQQAPWTQPGDLRHIQSTSQQSTSPEPKPKDKISFSNPLRRRREPSDTLPVLVPTVSTPPKRSPAPKPPPANPQNDSTSESTPTVNTIVVPTLEFNPWSDEPSSAPATPPTRPKPHPAASFASSSSPPTSHRTSFASFSSSIPSLTRTTSTSPSTAASTLLPGDHNSYRGLCKSAWRLQTGRQNKALRPITLPASAFSLTKRCWGCTECAFRGPLTKDQQTGKDAFDMKLYRSRDGRVKFRWLFLFRSHVKTKEREPARYSCVFCCEAMEKAGRLEVFETADGLVEHVGREHTGEGRWPEGRVLYNMNCEIEGGGGVGEGWDVLLCEGGGE